MKKQLQLLSLSFIIIFSIFVCTLSESFAFAQSPTTIETTNNLNQQTESSAKVPKTILEKNSQTLAHLKQEGTHSKFFKFVVSMFGVLVSALSIFIGLKIYKNLVLKNNSKLDIIDYDKNLESPKDFKEAINLFLDKTDK